MKINGKVFVVTGGGDGLGRQLVLQLLARGAAVAAVDINREGLEKTRLLAEKLAEKMSLHTLDIADRTAVTALVDEVIAQQGCVDALINNAGIIHRFEPVSELKVEVIDRVINVNLHGVINMTRAFLPVLQQRPVAHIVNVSSMGGLFAFPNQTIYGASKAAVKLFSEGLLAELRGTPIHVTVAFPGAISTSLTHNCGAHSDKIDKANRYFKGTPPHKAANKILYAIERNRFRVHIGIDSVMLSALYTILPTATILMVNKVMKLAMAD